MREARIVSRPAFRAAGAYYRGGNKTGGEIKALWDFKLLPRQDELSPIRVSGEAFGLFRGTDDPNGDFEYLAAVEVSPSARLPEGMVSWDVPADTYVVVRAEDLTQIGPVMDYIWGEWFAGSDEWECGPGLMFECYPPDFARPSMAVDVYWSIQRKKKQ
jgi:predicted transcriptional regulator YdeE